MAALTYRHVIKLANFPIVEYKMDEVLIHTQEKFYWKFPIHIAVLEMYSSIALFITFVWFWKFIEFIHACNIYLGDDPPLLVKYSYCMLSCSEGSNLIPQPHSTFCVHLCLYIHTKHVCASPWILFKLNNSISFEFFFLDQFCSHSNQHSTWKINCSQGSVSW